LALAVVRWVVVAGLVCAWHPSRASNTPCSGGKGGVSHCAGATFVCNDGSVSRSKKVCSMSAGGGSAMKIVEDGDCHCRSERVCVGPRSGLYCLSDSGRKSYLSK
jgi:hypothetical protein